jgi:hypothetical protein
VLPDPRDHQSMLAFKLHVRAAMANGPYRRGGMDHTEENAKAISIPFHELRSAA